MLGTIAIGALLCLLPIVYGNIIVYTQDTPRVIIEEFRDMPASFGNDLPPEGLRGFLVQGEPANGCSALAKPPNVDNFTGKWIVLVARYNCSFEVKVRNAQAAGYDCAIVHNVNSSELETMSAKDPDGIVIPSVFVSDQAGLILSQEYLFTKGTYVIVRSILLFPHKYEVALGPKGENSFYIMVNGDLPFNINTHLLLPFAIVVVLCLLVILVFMIVKCIKDRRQARRHRLPNRSLKKIPTCKFSKGDPYDTCAICLDDYQEGERLRVLPCAHAYHAACIDPWLTQNKRVCPVCKRRVFVAGERRRVDSDSDTDTSDHDTEPLLSDTHATQGGTFEEQQENPFVRAARFVRGLRRDAPVVTQDASTVEDVDETNNTNEEIAGDERRPLLLPAVATLSSERRRRRRTRTAPRAHPTHHAHAPQLAHAQQFAHAQQLAHASQPAPAEPPAPAQPAASPSAALLRTDTHSINNEAAGEIGVAALPATQLATSAPHQVHL